jgi:hypothetical protein
MKALYLTIIFVAIFGSSHAQWTISGTNISNTNSGYVGIGLTSPSANLSIFDPTGSMPGGVSAPTKSILNLSRFGTPGYSYNEGAEFRIGHGGPSGWGSKVDFYINGASNQTGIPDQQVMTWLYNGNVGIGTTSPGSTLTVSGNNGNAYPGNTATFSSNVGSGTSIGNQINISSSTAFWGLLAGWDGSGVSTTSYHSPNAGYLINVQNAPLYLGANNAPWLTILPTGNVGIGTTNPQGYMLAVNGSAIATSMTVKLKANWPDYVFKKDYRLPTLGEVKNYIEQNHHLPEMPSAADIEKDGLNLGEANKLLTKKVEELTLYIIDQDKIEKEQQTKISSQEDRIARLEKALEHVLADKQKKN